MTKVKLPTISDSEYAQRVQRAARLVADGDLDVLLTGNKNPIDPAATANDSGGDSHWDGGSLTVQIAANAEADDTISILNTVLGKDESLKIEIGAKIAGPVS